MSQQPSQPLVPIVNLPYKYAYGCDLIRTSNTVLTLVGGFPNGQMRDSTNTFDIISPLTPNLTINSSINGAGGLDTGTVAINTMYCIYILYDATNTVPPSTLMSTSYIAPVLPSVNGVTYGAFRLIGFWLTDGSGNFVLGTTYNFGSLRYFQYDAPVRVLNAGTASSANVNLAPAVPISGRGRVSINATYTPNAAGQTASVKPIGNTNNLVVINGIVASVAQTNFFSILPLNSGGTPQLTYSLSVTTSPAALTLDVLGFEFSLF